MRGEEADGRYLIRSNDDAGHVRLKDLRSISVIYAERAGVPLTVASKVLGHADSSMTRRYQRHGAAMSDQQAADIEHALGLTG